MSDQITITCECGTGLIVTKGDVPTVFPCPTCGRKHPIPGRRAGAAPAPARGGGGFFKGLFVTLLLLAAGGGIGAVAYHFLPTEHRKAYLDLQSAPTTDAAAEFLAKYPLSRRRGDVDEILWSTLAKSEEAEEVDRYLQALPDGKHRDEAAETAAFLRLRDSPATAAAARFLREHPASSRRDEVDEILWKLGDARAYLDDFPNGRHAAEARETLAFELLRSSPSIPAALRFLKDFPGTGRRREIEEIVWSAARSSDDYRTYLANFPGGAHEKEAKEELAFSALRASPSVEAALTFLKTHPGSSHRGEADDLLWGFGDARAYLGALSDGRHAAEARETLAYTAVQSKPSIAGAAQFLRDHPQSPRKAEIEDLLWKLARESDRAPDYEAYLRALPYGRHAREAREIVAFDALQRGPSLEAAVRFLEEFPASPRARDVRMIQLAMLEKTPIENAHAPSAAVLRRLFDALGSRSEISVSIAGFPCAGCCAGAVRARLETELRRFGIALADAPAGPQIRVRGDRTYDKTKVYSSNPYADGPWPETVTATVELVFSGDSSAAWSTSFKAESPERVRYTRKPLAPDLGPNQAEVHAATVEKLADAVTPLFQYPRK